MEQVKYIVVAGKFLDEQEVAKKLGRQVMKLIATKALVFYAIYRIGKAAGSINSE